MLMKRLSYYSVNVYQRDFDALCSMGVVSEKVEGVYVVEYAGQYDEHIGLRTENRWTKESIVI